jgi:FixJ family two-component response regulator
MTNGQPLSRLDDAGVVCVIDDDDDARKALQRLLRSIGLAVETFSSPQAFLAHPLADRPSCLVLVITAHDDTGTRERAQKATTTEHPAKPFEDQSLLCAIHHAIRQASGRGGDAP